MSKLFTKEEIDRINADYELIQRDPAAAVAAIRERLEAVNWTADDSIRELAIISRNPHSNVGERRDARNMILLITGAICSFTDSTGTEIYSPVGHRQFNPELYEPKDEPPKPTGRAYQKRALASQPSKGPQFGRDRAARR